MIPLSTIPSSYGYAIEPAYVKKVRDNIKQSGLGDYTPVAVEGVLATLILMNEVDCTEPGEPLVNENPYKAPEIKVARLELGFQGLSDRIGKLEYFMHCNPVWQPNEEFFDGMNKKEVTVPKIEEVTVTGSLKTVHDPKPGLQWVHIEEHEKLQEIVRVSRICSKHVGVTQVECPVCRHIMFQDKLAGARATIMEKNRCIESLLQLMWADMPGEQSIEEVREYFNENWVRKTELHAAINERDEARGLIQIRDNLEREVEELRGRNANQYIQINENQNAIRELNQACRNKDSNVDNLVNEKENLKRIIDAKEERLVELQQGLCDAVASLRKVGNIV